MSITLFFLLGSKEDRIQKTLEDIGPAVLNGGFSTFLAFIFTGSSNYNDL